jgi:hypothetical protein
MYAALRKSTSRLLARSRAILDALAGLDAPHGDDLTRLERRVRQLEADSEASRSGLKPASLAHPENG